MSMKSPLADDVFAKWLERADMGKLEKLFSVKRVKFERANVSAAESVKNVEKHAVFFFHSRIEPSSTTEVEKNVVNYEDLQKVTFHHFENKEVDSTEWKDENVVPLHSSIKEIRCDECSGKGFITCDKCNGSGALACKKCNGSGNLTCPTCKGDKKLYLKLKVMTEGKKTDMDLPHNCYTCGGLGTIKCTTCGGTGKVDCDKCHGEAKTTCKQCKGTGTMFEYANGAVPFKTEGIPHLFFRAEFEKHLADVINKEFANIEGISVKDYNSLNEKEITPQLGFYNKEVEDKMNKARTTFKDLEKKGPKGAETPEYPIFVYPLLKLDMVTPKGKKFSVFSIGTDKKYVVTDYDF
ncbi:MAG: hypothetical protein WED07_08685 [Candidatus Freyarchaeum deiterrae]